MRHAEAILPAAVVDERRLATLTRSGLLAPGAESDLDRWTAGLCRATGAAVAAISVLDGGHVFVKSLCGAGGSVAEPARVDSTRSLAEHLMAATQPVLAADGSAAYAAAPIVVDGETVAMIGIADHALREWTDADLGMLRDASAAVSAEIRLRLANDDTVRAHALLGSHGKVHELIAAAAPLHDVLVELIGGIERHDPSVLPSVVLLDRDSSTLHPSAGPSLPADWLATVDGLVIGPNVGTCGAAAWSGRLVITEDIAQDPNWAPVRELALGFGLRHCWSMPIKSSAGDVLGTLALYGRTPRTPQPEHLTLMSDGARIAGIAIERHRALERLTHDARHDGLTGLPNRTRIFEALDDAIARARPRARVAVMFVDLDSLKALNDSLGHDRADDVIREVGARLAAAVRGEDFVGRFGGDEFVVVAQGLRGDAEAAVLASRILETVARPLPGIDSIAVTASIGVAMLSRGPVDAREVLRRADSAMYDAKRAGRDRCAFYEGVERILAGRRPSIARNLRDAELRGELGLVFQPVFDIPSQSIVAVEALARWWNPELRSVPPAEFIPIAEETGTIVPLGAWVLRESCEGLVRFEAETGLQPELAVNVSAHQLVRPGFALSVRQTLIHAGFPAERLTLEITEAALIEPDAVTVQTLRELSALGARIVLDNFGTGLFSLSWLKRRHLDAIKIDRSFIAELADDPRDRAIVEAVTTMARALSCTVTAEGVESAEQLEILRSLHCDRAQGFFLSPPLELDQLLELVG